MKVDSSALLILWPNVNDADGTPSFKWNCIITAELLQAICKNDQVST